jgi:hypothetical protein
VALPCRVRNQQPQPEQHSLNTEIERFKTSSEPLTDIGASIGNPELETLPATLRNQPSSGATRALPLFGAAELT